MRVSRKAAACAVAPLMAAGLVAAAAPATADYGPTAVRQIELSMNIPGHEGGGVWLWLELSNDGTVDYQGSDCGHAGQGAAHDGGDTTWQLSNGRAVIPNVILEGLGGFPATITVPWKTGHYTGADDTFITLPGFIPGGIGFSQLQVAP